MRSGRGECSIPFLEKAPSMTDYYHMRILWLAAMVLLCTNPLAAQQRTWIRINQLGYLPNGPKTAVACSLQPVTIRTFTLQDSEGRVVLGPRKAVAAGSFAACASTHRLDFSSVTKPGRYTLV